MANRKSNVKKPKSETAKMASAKGGDAEFEMGAPKPVRKQKKKK